jgi:pyruvate-formate lyase-activating enzyme
MNIHSVLYGSANGPGLRTVVWTQGCTLKCPGRTNPRTHPHGIGRNVQPDELARELFLAIRPGTEGITFSGGEPMQQAASLYELICAIKARWPDYSIGLILRVDLAGFHGEGCGKVMDDFTAGAKVINVTNKPEYLEEEEATEREKATL